MGTALLAWNAASRLPDPMATRSPVWMSVATARHGRWSCAKSLISPESGEKIRTRRLPASNAGRVSVKSSAAESVIHLVPRRRARVFISSARMPRSRAR
jgi:hypothetical protein